MKRADGHLTSHRKKVQGNAAFPIVCLTLCSILPFISSLWGDFVFDDSESVLNNPVVTSKVPLYEIWSRDFWGRSIVSPESHKSYRPVTTFTFWLNWQLHEKSTLGYHLVNLILHAAVTLQLYFVITNWEKDTSFSVAFPSALIFAIHPIHSEAVANVTGRAELLSALFGLIGLLYFHKSMEYMGSFSSSSLIYTVIMLLSLLSKEQGISFLPISFIICLVFNQKRWKSIGLQIFSTLLIFAWARIHINNYASPRFSSFDNPAAFLSNPILKLTNFCYIWCYHLYLLIFPVFLCFDYSMGSIPLIETFSDIRVLSVPFLLFLITSLVIIYMKTEGKYQSIFLLAVLIGILSFLPASNLLVTVGFTVAERVLYLPSIGYSVLLGMLYNCLKQSGRLNDLPIFIIIGIAFGLCYQRGIDWSSEYSLYSSGLKVCPENAKIHYNLAKVLRDHGATSQAEKNYWEALRLNPSYEHAMNNLANILEKDGRNNEAEALLRQAVRLSPNFATAWMNLGITLMKNGKFSESETSFRNSLKIRPLSADCYYNMGNLYRRMNQLVNAKDCWMNATSIDPDHQSSWTNLLVVLDVLHECETVLVLSHRILDRRIANSAIYSQIGTCYAQVGNFEEAERNLLHAIQLSPKMALYQANLGVLYQRWRRLRLAEMQYLNALKLDGRLSGVRQNLELIQRQRNGTRLH